MFDEVTAEFSIDPYEEPVPLVNEKQTKPRRARPYLTSVKLCWPVEMETPQQFSNELAELEDFFGVRIGSTGTTWFLGRPVTVINHRHKTSMLRAKEFLKPLVAIMERYGAEVLQWDVRTD